MTSTASFKDKIKQAYSIFKWDLKACSGTLVVFSILATVFMIVILTLCLVMGFSTNQVNQNGYVSTTVNTSLLAFASQLFQMATSSMIYALTVIFTIFYTVKVFSYLHNKRKADLYGALPVSRITLFLSKTATAFLLSLVPAMFFMGIMTLISVCLGQPIVTDASMMYPKLIMGTFACVSAYGLISVCCGTTINSVIMFISVCIAYPLSAMFFVGVIGSFFPGLYLGIFKDSFIMNALNPLAAYNGVNLIYWLLFSVVCLVVASFLAKKRKAERAQSSFAYYLPCHIIKIIVAFLIGMFLGVTFGALNVFGYGYLGFIFGFVLGSVPAFIICHLIFYKGFSRLLKTSAPLAGLIVVVMLGMAFCDFDMVGYNNFLPKSDEVESAGFIDSEYCYQNDKSEIGRLTKDAATDFSDKDNINTIVSYHNSLISETKQVSSEKYACVWEYIIANNLPVGTDQTYSIAYKLNSGKTVTRVYSNSFITSYDPFAESTEEALSYQKKYIQKYSAMARMDIDKNCTLMSVAGSVDENQVGMSRVLQKNKSETADMTLEPKYTQLDLNTTEKIRNAFMKDLISDTTKGDDVLCEYFNTYDDMSTNYSYSSVTAMTNETMMFWNAKENNSDLVCQITIETNKSLDSFTSILLNSTYFGQGDNIEVFMVPTRYTNTIKALKEAKILNDDLTIVDNDYIVNGN